MQCLKCGKEIGAKLGMCEECTNKKKGNTPPPAVESPNEPETAEIEAVEQPEQCSSKTLLYTILLGYVLVAVTGVALFWPTSNSEPLQFRVSDSQVFVTQVNNPESVLFDITEPFEAFGRILSLTPHKPSIEKGVSFLELLYLNEDDYHTYLSDYLVPQRDPGSFLKKVAKWVFLISDDPIFIEAASALRLSGGETIELRGHVLTLVENNYAGENRKNVKNSFTRILALAINTEERRLSANTFSTTTQPETQVSQPTLVPELAPTQDHTIQQAMPANFD